MIRPRLARTKAISVSVGLSLGLIATACSSSSSHATSSGGSTSGSSSGSGSGTTGVAGSSASTITIGIVTPLTGSAAVNYKGSVESAQARIDLQNANGGVNGHMLKLIVADDQSSPTANLTATQSLISKGAFGIVGSSAFTFGSYRYLHQQGVPVTGGGYDGPEWGQQPNTNMFAYASNLDPHLPQYDQPAKLMKQLGVTRVASVAYGISPSSVAAAKGFMFSAKNAGLQQAYLDTSLPFGTVNAGPIALALKSTKADGIELPIDDETAFAIITAAQQAGVHLAMAIAATGYGQDLLDQPSTTQAAQGVYFSLSTAPVELHTAATTAMQGAFAKYEHFTGVPNLNWYQGWIATDMMIKGLELAGKNPTRTGFITALRGVTEYNADGLLGGSVDFSKFGQAPQQSCGWYMKLVGSKFVPYPTDGKPVCGSLIPNSNQA